MEEVLRVDVDEVCSFVRTAALDPVAAERATVEAALAAIGTLRAWCDGREAGLAERLIAVAGFPEQAVAEATKTSLREAMRVFERVATIEAVPALADALAAGELGGSHVDAVTRALARVEPVDRPALVDAAAPLLDAARSTSADELARRLGREARRIEQDRGRERFERQRRETRVTYRVDGVSGMWRLHGDIDPFHGLLMANRLDATVDALFAEQTPATCPSDPVLRQAHLRALALLELCGIDTSQLDASGPDAPGIEPGSGPGATPGNSSTSAYPSCRCGGGGVRLRRGGPPRVDVTVVVDTRVTDPADGGPLIDWGQPVEIPRHVLTELMGAADVHTVVVRNGVVLHAPGTTDLGRSTRLANRAQRRALRAMHPTCAVPGCSVRFERCKIHHITWWRDGGATDLANLLPLCPHHHRRLHDELWTITLGSDRSISIRHRDGSVLTAGSPTRGGP